MLIRLRERLKKGLSPSTKLFLVILPSIIACFLYSYRPLVGLGYAFVEYKPRVSMWESEFVGLKYFKMMVMNQLRRRELLMVLRNTLAMNLIGWLTSLLPVITTLFLNEIRSKRYKKLVQSVITIPNFLSWVIIYAAVYNLLAPGSGMISNLLRDWGIIEGNFELMTSPKYGWLFMWILGTWKSMGWNTIIYFSALSSVDQELYEAAEIDGAGRFQKMRYISIPCLMPTYITLLIMSIGSFLGSDFERAFNFVNAFNRSTVETLDLYVYNIGLVGFNISLGTAIGLTKSVLGLILMFFSNYLSKKIRGYAIF